MKITKIKKLKNGKYKLFLETGEEVVTYDDLILQKELLLRKEIDFEELKLLSLETDYYEVYYKMVKKVGMKFRSEKEIKKLLEKEMITEKEKKSIVEKLKENKIIDDERFKRSYINDKVYLSSDGPYAILRNLEELGIEIGNIDTLFTEEQIKALYDKLKHYIEKKIKGNIKYSRYILKQKIVETLMQKGFEREKIIEVFDSFEVENVKSIQKEYQRIYNKMSKKYDGAQLQFSIKQKLLSKGFQTDEIESIIQND